MFEYIEKLRQKPEKTKKQVAFLIALSFSGLIFVIWLSVIFPEWREGERKEAKVVKSEPTPLSGFMANLSAGIDGMKEQFSELKDTVTSLAPMSTTSVAQSATTTSNE